MKHCVHLVIYACLLRKLQKNSEPHAMLKTMRNCAISSPACCLLLAERLSSIVLKDLSLIYFLDLGCMRMNFQENYII